MRIAHDSAVLMLPKEWRDIMTRLGRWIDFDNDYKTMYPWFMERVWLVALRWDGPRQCWLQVGVQPAL